MAPSGLAAGSGKPGGLLAACRRGRVAAVQKLLAEGAAINQFGTHGITPLYAAAKEGHSFVVQLLIRKGADVDVDQFESLTGCSCGSRQHPRQNVEAEPVLPPDAWQNYPPAAPSGPRSLLKPRVFESIDLAPFVHPENYDDSARLRSAQAWDRSFRTIGFAVIEGHGVTDDLVEDMRTAARMFFRSGSDAKHRYYQGPKVSGRSGYSPVGGAGRQEAGHSDPVEGYTFIRTHTPHRWNNPKEKHPDELNGIGQRYCDEMERVMHALHRMSALALGLDMNYFDEFYNDPASVLVISNYPPLRQPLKVPEGKLRYRAHSDYTGFTILLQDESDFGEGGAGGLEVDIAGCWVPVKPKKGSLVVNIGDLFELWTNDRWRSTPHRVVSPRLRDPAAGRARLTAMLFSGPNLEKIISPIHTCVDAEHPSRYPSMNAAQHMAEQWKSKSKEARYKPG